MRSRMCIFIIISHIIALFKILSKKQAKIERVIFYFLIQHNFIPQSKRTLDFVPYETKF